MVELSVIIPAYNEEGRLPKTLASVHQYLMERGGTFEIIIVNDGSKDKTIEVVDDFARHNDFVRLISYAPNQGKGFAIRTGIMAAEGEKLLINDADGSSPIEELDFLEAAFAEGADLAIGSRAKPTAQKKVAALAYRTFMGNTFNKIVQALLLPGIYDTQCGFKLFKRHCAKDIFSVARQNGFAFDVEVLFIAKIRGYKIAEIAINWQNAEGSKVNVMIDSMKMLMEILRIRCIAFCGGYKPVGIAKQNPLPFKHSCEHSNCTVSDATSSDVTVKTTDARQ